METRIVKIEMDPGENGALLRPIKFDFGGRSVVLAARAASRRSWFVRRIPHIETRTLWRCERGLARPQTPLSHFRTDIQRGLEIGLVCFAKPQAGFRIPKSDL